ncbi:MAG TPA: sugar transferase [Methylomirabilota bacterium]|nr:sugar transferase [Methylomirabilota bacterium]
MSRAPSLVVPIARTPLGYRIAKRSLDLAASLLGLVLVSPILALVAIAVKLESRGPVLFRQERLGLGGRPFTLYKFRSMFSSAEQGRHRDHARDLIRGDAAAADGGEKVWVPIAADPRVTRLGAFLRRSHLDELPQLINIVRGEMSLVGPRPPIPYEVEVYEPWHLRRLSVIPGLTGLWQATAWGRITFDEGVALDLEYVDRRSFGFDLRLIGRTLWQIAIGRQF